MPARYLFHRLCFVIFAAVLLTAPAPARAQEPVAYGVFFYSPSCPHCHDVIINHWPAIQEEFGDQLQVLFVNVSSEQGSLIMLSSVEALGIQSRGVPMLLLGSEVLIGSIDIPARAPEVIRAGLAAGGIGLPAVPGIEEVFEIALERSIQEEEAAPAEDSAAPEQAAQPLVEQIAGRFSGMEQQQFVLRWLVTSLVVAVSTLS